MALDNYYSDGPEQAPETETPESMEGEEQTAVLPKTVLEGKELKPGDIIELRIVSTDGDQIQVAPVETETEDEEETEEETESEGEPEPEDMGQNSGGMEMPGMAGLMG